MKNHVREFYDTIGWSRVGDGLYQNARYEDLRPVSQEYIHNCHLRVKRHLAPTGKYLLDAGSGPIQYPEYLTYSEGYRYRVCADISITALREARKKIGGHGLYVVADIANLPFKTGVFDGVVSLHTIHHLPLEEHPRAYAGLHRVLAAGRAAVVVNGWSRSPLMDPFRALSRLRKRAWLFARKVLRGRGTGDGGPGTRDRGPGTGDRGLNTEHRKLNTVLRPPSPKNTFVEKHDPAWFKRTIAPQIPAEILVWRAASVHFLKNYIHEHRGGRRILRLLYRLEERFPRWFGEKGTYPLIVIRKA